MSQENKTNWVQKLKAKWQIESDFRFWKIFVGFGITGTSCSLLTKPINSWITTNYEVGFWAALGLRILLVFLIYQVLLLIIGTIIGEFHFFYGFEKKMWLYLGKILKKRQ